MKEHSMKYLNTIHLSIKGMKDMENKVSQIPRDYGNEAPEGNEVSRLYRSPEKGKYLGC